MFKCITFNTASVIKARVVIKCLHCLLVLKPCHMMPTEAHEFAAYYIAVALL